MSNKSSSSSTPVKSAQRTCGVSKPIAGLIGDIRYLHHSHNGPHCCTASSPYMYIRQLNQQTWAHLELSTRRFEAVSASIAT